MFLAGCPTGQYLMNGTCVAQCPSGSFPSNVTVANGSPSPHVTVNPTEDDSVNRLECLPCYHSCATCFGSSPSECATCMPGSHLVYKTCIANPANPTISSPTMMTLLPPSPSSSSITTLKDHLRMNRLAIWVAAVSCIFVAVMMILAVISYGVYLCTSRHRQGQGHTYGMLNGVEDPADNPASFFARNLNLASLPSTVLGKKKKGGKTQREKLLEDSTSDSEI